MPADLDFGMFDWLDAGSGSTAELYESRLRLIEQADKAGFYGYHLAEHHATPLGMAPSPSLFFAALAERTSRIRFSPMAALLPLYHPLRLVEEICMLDHLSGGRVEVGVSRGVSPYEAESFNVDSGSTREVFEEALEIYRAAMTQSVLDHDGKHFQFRDVPMEIRPLQKPYPPLWYPSFSEDGATYAASNGFHFMSLGPPSLVTHLMNLYREVAERQRLNSDKPNAQSGAPKLAAMRQIFVAETDSEAMEIAEPAYADWYRSITKLWHRRGDSSYDSFFDWEKSLAGETILIGSVDHVREKIQQLVVESGINYFVGSFAWGSLGHDDSRHSLELFATKIAPELKGA